MNHRETVERRREGGFDKYGTLVKKPAREKLVDVRGYLASSSAPITLVQGIDGGWKDICFGSRSESELDFSTSFNFILYYLSLRSDLQSSSG